jgi:hypothetical protein
MISTGGLQDLSSDQNLRSIVPEKGIGKIMITIDFKEVKEKVSPIVHYCTHVPGFT